MQRRFFSVVLALGLGMIIGFGCSESTKRGEGTAKAESNDTTGEKSGNKFTKVQRFGSVIGLKAEKKDYYNELHAKPWPEVTAMITKCNIRNYSIYEGEIDGKLYLFSYFEYVGDDFEADMKKMAADPKTQEWWKETDPCQIRLSGTPDGKQWRELLEVFHQ